MGFLEGLATLATAVLPPLTEAYVARRGPRIVFGGGPPPQRVVAGAPMITGSPVSVSRGSMMPATWTDWLSPSESESYPTGPTLTPDLPLSPDFGTCANIFYTQRPAGMTLKREVIIPRPDGGVAYYVHRGRPVLFSGDLRLMKRLDRIGRRFASKSGASRRSGKGRRLAA